MQACCCFHNFLHRVTIGHVFHKICISVKRKNYIALYNLCSVVGFISSIYIFLGRGANWGPAPIGGEDSSYRDGLLRGRPGAELPAPEIHPRPHSCGHLHGQQGGPGHRAALLPQLPGHHRGAHTSALRQQQSRQLGRSPRLSQGGRPKTNANHQAFEDVIGKTGLNTTLTVPSPVS